MKRIKRWTMPALIVGALAALLVPAAASASRLEYKGGGIVPAGSRLVAKSVGPITMNNSSLGALPCESMAVQGSVTKNDGSTFAASTGGLFTAWNCLNNGNQLNMENIEWNNLTSATVYSKGIPIQQTNNVEWTIQYSINGTKCRFTSTVTPFSFENGSGLITFTKAGKFKSVACGSMTIGGTFQLESEKAGISQPVVLSY